MVMTAILIAVAMALAVPATAEEFTDGLAAYDGGDYAETVRIWEALAADGDPRAQRALAGLYRSGEGVGQDLPKAARLYRLAAEQGNDDAQLNLGRMYLDGVGVERDPVQAYLWLGLAAAPGRRWAEDRQAELATTMSSAQLAEAEREIATFTVR
jgi:TPR repeat protein